MKKLLFTVLLAFSAGHIHAQLTAKAGNDTTICLGDSLVLGGKPGASGGMSPYNYTWFPNVNISSVTDSNPSAWPSSNTVYYLVVGDANGRSDTDSVVVHVLPPESIFIVPFLDVCLYDKLLVLNIASPQGGYYTGDGINDSVHLDPFFAGVGFHPIKYYYWDTVCLSWDSAETTVQIHQNPKLTLMPDRDTICKGDTALVVTSGGQTYTWNPNVNLQFLSSDSVNVISDSSISYKVITTGSGQCKDSSTYFLIVEICETGMNGPRPPVNFRLYPNPASNVLYLRFDEGPAPQRLDIRSSSGQLLRSLSGKGLKNLEIDVSDLMEGIYFLTSPEWVRAMTFGISR